MKPKTWVIHNHTWLFTLFVRIDPDLKRATRWVDRKLGTNWSKQSTLVGRSFLPAEGSDVAICFPDVPGAGTIAHESLHCVAHVLDHKGLGGLSPQTDEAYAYLLDWCVREIANRVW